MGDLRHLLAAEIPRLRRYTRALVNEREAADDLVESCLRRALNEQPRRYPPWPLRLWLFRVQHEVLAHRPHGRTRDNGSAGRSPAPKVEDGGRGTSVALDATEQALHSLALSDKAALLLVGLEGMTHCEAAAILDVPVSAVRFRLLCAREALRAAVDRASPSTLGAGLQSVGRGVHGMY